MISFARVLKSRKEYCAMKFAVVAREKNDQTRLETLVKRRKHKLAKNPDMVICMGGDGTILFAERKFPGIPKLPLKNSEVCNNCNGYDTPEDEILATIERGAYALEEHAKLRAEWMRGKKKMGEYVCTNDFMIRNQLLFQALRFQITIDDEIALSERMIGDGVVVATAFGSRAYYKSITKTSFSEGVGIALNNCSIEQRGIKTSRDKTIRVKILRMTADFAVDNDTLIETLEPGDEIVITASAEKMRLVRT